MANKKQKVNFYTLLIPIIFPIILLILGILLISRPAIVTKLFEVVGCITMLVGFAELVVFFARKEFAPQNKFAVQGAILLVFGAVLLMIPIFVNTFLPILIAAFVLICCISGFLGGGRSSMPAIIMTFVGIVLSIVLFIYVIVAKNVGYNVIGILMIISAILRLATEAYAKVTAKPMDNDSIIDVETNDYNDSSTL